MDYEQAVALEGGCLAQVFNRLPLLLVRGEDVHVFDDEGNRYLDFYAGIAVSNVGHAHPHILDALKTQAAKLIHASNWVYTEPQLTLAEKLTKLTSMERLFYANDGSAAVETALKLARKHTGKPGIIAIENGFHGRTMGALSATWPIKYREPFQPLVPGFKFAKYNSIDSLRKSITADTAAVIVEPIQGEGGIIVPDDDYLKGVRELTAERDILMIVDEVQTGFGRTGSWFDIKRAGVKPDILVVAKGMGGGFPIGATLYSGMDFESGQQGGTYVGSPLACACANAVLEVIEEQKLVENSQRMGRYLTEGLSGHSVHGRGLMVGVDVADGRGTALKLIKKGVVVIYSGNTIRLLPPLTIKKEHAEIVIKALDEVV